MVSVIPGCGLLISQSGIGPGAPESRELVHRQFGRPNRTSTTTLHHRLTGETREFEVEHYHVHRKFRPRYAPGFYPILLDPLLVPVAIANAGREIAKGHELEFVYDDKGRTIGARYPCSIGVGSPRSPKTPEYRDDWSGSTNQDEPKRLGQMLSVFARTD
ncbi:MAG: hypothetical protein JNM43_21300 [Planctomycetaceae bacterium]|nr:hypothetical protein [Planctomycetaceae bacterium]